MDESQHLTAKDHVMPKSVAPTTRLTDGQSGRPGIGGKFWGWLWLACWLTVAGAFLVSWLNPSRSSLPPAVASQTASAPAPFPSVAIDKLKVGDRVVGTFSSEELAGETEVDPATWRLLQLEAVSVDADGRTQSVRVKTLQPMAWIVENDARVGGLVPPPVDLLEMGFSPTLQATVIAIHPCPQIQSGPGRVVLSTIENSSDDLYELTFATPEGASESVRCTGKHPFYRETDSRWIAAHDLAPGDLLQGAESPLVLHKIAKLDDEQPVFNLTVEREHVYRVSHLGALAHNMCETDPNGLRLYQLDTSGVASRKLPGLPEFDGTTRGYLVTKEGKVVPLESGPRTGARFPYSQADGHLETSAARWMKENGVTEATVYHNNPKGTCGNCDYYVRTFLGEGSTLHVVPPPNAVAPTPRWKDVPTSYTGNSKSAY